MILIKINTFYIGERVRGKCDKLTWDPFLLSWLIQAVQARAELVFPPLQLHSEDVGVKKNEPDMKLAGEDLRLEVYGCRD